MKKILIIFGFLLLNLNLSAQSKKEIIQTLTNRIDSLNLEITNRDSKFEKELSSLNKDKELLLFNISKLENNLISLKENITKLNSKLFVFKDSIDILKSENKLFLSNQKDYGNEVVIGTQIWSKMNLDVTTYSDGTPIPQVTDPEQWANLTTGAWCYYNNDSFNGKTYGKLYNWYAVAGIYNAASAKNPTLRKKLAPIGWHVPNDKEWTTLFDFLGGELVAGGKMKSPGILLWKSPNALATNSSGFTGLPGGCRHLQGEFFGYFRNEYNHGGYGNWWSSSDSDVVTTSYIYLDYESGKVEFDNDYIFCGFSVRCLKD
jgi:uncharacterized protein (TIGR02145 family)